MNTIKKWYKILILAIVILAIAPNTNAQDSYILEMDHICSDHLVSDLQKDQAKKLKDAINIPILEAGLPAVDFKVLGYNLYPVLGSVDEKFGMESAFEMVEADLVGKTNYLALVKYYSQKEQDEHSLVQEKVLKYKVFIDLPDVGGYENMSEFEVDALVTHIRSFLIDKSNESNNPVAAEVSAMREMQEYLKEPKDLEDLLLDLQFSRIEMPSEDEFSITRNSEDLEHTIIDAYDNVYNYGGYVLNGQTLEETLQTDDPGDISTISSSFYLAGKEVGDTPSEFQDFYDQFANDQAKVKMFIYFNFETPGINTISKGGNSDSRDGEEDAIRYCYYKVDENLTDEESEEILNSQYEKRHEENTSIESDAELTGSCDPSWQFGKKCIYNHTKTNAEEFGLIGDYVSLQAATIAGFVDGFLGTIQFLIDGTTILRDCILKHAGDFAVNPHAKVLAILVSAYHNVFEDEENNPWEVLKDIANDVVTLSPIGAAAKYLYDFAKIAINYIKEQISDKFGGSAADYIAYQIGVVSFDAVMTGVTGGSYLGAKVIARGAQVALKVGKSVKKCNGSLITAFNKFKDKIKTTPASRRKTAYCTVGSGGCFIKDTPVLLAAQSNQYYFKNKGKALAIVAAMPIAAVPIQEVELLDYAITHKTVNSTYGITASTNEDIYLGLMDKDPYTSDEQRLRDKYEINDTDWNEVIFEEINGSSTAKLALHSDWIYDKGYQIETVVNMNLPEQGISGPFAITSIKHIIPQKKPTEEDENDEYVSRPVTALFTHVSDQIYNISFDNGEDLGVTYQHPIYSVTEGDWRLAGELKIGEEVLTRSGEAKVTKSTKEKGREEVYNLEVKEMHNFLVGKSGIVVHNAYKKSKVLEWLDNLDDFSDLADDSPAKAALVKLKQMKDEVDPNFQKYLDDFDDIPLELGEEGIKIWKVLGDFPKSIRSKVLNLEAGIKLDGLNFHTDVIQNNKYIKQIIEGIDQIGEQGIYVLNKIKSSSFEDISGYKELVKGIKKVGGTDYTGNVAYEVRQTFQKLDADVNIPNSKKVLGDKLATPPPDGPNPATDFDVDYGVKSDSGTPKYTNAYQFKVKNANKVVKAMDFSKVKFQLLNANAENRILQVAIREGTGTLDDVTGVSNFNSKLDALKDAIPGFKLVITDHLGVILGTF